MPVLFGFVPLAALVLTAPLSAPRADPPAARAPAATTWKIDNAHSEIAFRIRHMVGRVNGRFRDFSGSITGTPPAWSGAAVAVDIQTASIDTRIARRDEQLRSPDFFDTRQFPGMTFRSTKVQVTGKKLRLFGNLTIRGITKAVVLDGEYLGESGKGTGLHRVGFQAATVINRLDYGIRWNSSDLEGGAVLGNDVEIVMDIEAIKDD